MSAALAASLALVTVAAPGLGPSRAATAGRDGGGGTVRHVAPGSWGGRHVRLVVTEGSAAIEFDCAHGAIAGPIALAKDGSFSAPGTFVTERGSESAGEERPSRDATYAGQVNDKEMTLTVTLVESGEDLGSFTLVLGQDARLRKCR